MIPILALLVIAWLLMSLTVGEWKSLLVVLVAAIVVYVLSLPSRRASRAARVEPAA